MGSPKISRRKTSPRTRPVAPGHEFEASIRSNSHDCLAGNADCVETFVIETAYDDASRFIGTVRGTDESVSVEYTVVPVDVMNTEISEH